ncbi:MAG: arylsulfatase, partial [Bacteroidota bacterium]
MRFSQFYNTARCCPTRASLLTGLFPHQTGIGQMTNSPTKQPYQDWGTEGYMGYLNQKCVTIAEALQSNGYHTYMAGKWHLGYHEQERWPRQRGFDKFYGIISGASSYFWPNGKRGLTYMNEALPAPDSTSYYTTDAFTDYALQFIKEQADDAPYFLYLAYTAPHWPLHAREEDIARFVGKYQQGWDQLRRDRHQRQVEMGLLPDQGISLRDDRVRPWEELSPEEQELVDYRMAVYAAQIYAVDYNIGRLTGQLAAQGELDNTLILFLSDNGGCAEMYDELGTKPQSWINRANFGGAVSYGIGWANASNTPFRGYKVKTLEGGISTPLIAHWPAQIKEQQGKITDHRSYLIDIMPTILDLAEADYPDQINQVPIHPLEGKSLLSVLKTGQGEAHPYMYWEHQNNCAIRKGDWKAVKVLPDTNWQLYNLAEDRIEANNIAVQHPELVQELNEK